MQEIGVWIVRLNWMALLVVNEYLLGFVPQPNLSVNYYPSIS